MGEARARRLADETQWLRLGHWRKTLFGGWRSQVDGPAFFLAEHGVADPAAELEATLRAIFDDAGTDPDAHVQCRFPARAAWLYGRLGIDPAVLPPRRCPKFEAFWDRMQPGSATLVFSSYYLNNPASAFGHTFLRVNKGGEAGEGERAELLDVGIDYSATVTTSNAFIYGFKGLFGLFHGDFNHYPYYYKVREYGDYESRDLWEYDLQLSRGALAMLVAHVWELGHSYFDYWYLDENCSYHMLSLLETAEPTLELVDHVRGPVVVPADTVKALFANAGLVRRVRWRPSIHTQFRARIASMAPAQRELAMALVENADAPLPRRFSRRESAAALDAALDYIDFRFTKQQVHETEHWSFHAKQRLLERRAALGVVSAPLAPATPLREQPHAGHGSLRAGAGGGWSSARGAFVALEGRLSLHDLSDPPRGYPSLAQIEFLPVRLRYNARDRSLWLEDASLVRIVSLSVMDEFDHQVSWKLNVGATTVRDAACDGCLAGVAELGGGVAQALGPDVLAFAMADVQLLGSPRLLRAGVGPSGGVRARFGEHLTALATARWLYMPFEETRSTWSLGLAARWHLARGLSLALDWRRHPIANELSGGLLAYF